MITISKTTIRPSERSTYTNGVGFFFFFFLSPRRPASVTPSRRSPSLRRSVARSVSGVTGLTEDSKMAQEPPENEEDEYSAEATPAHLLRAVPCGQAAQ